MIRDVADIVGVVLVREHGSDQVYRVYLEDETICFVPIDSGNSDYKLIQEWEAEGNTPKIEDL
jgi:hypothetical protein